MKFFLGLNWLSGHLSGHLCVRLLLLSVLMLELKNHQIEAWAAAQKTMDRLTEGLSDWSEAELSEIAVGAMIGEPTALNARFFLGTYRALSLQIGRNFSSLSAYQISTDCLVYFFDPFSLNDFELDAYLGPGLSLNVWETESSQAIDNRILRERQGFWSIGLRGVAGVSTYLKQPALELVLELAPGLNVGRYVDFNVQFGLGLLYRFPKGK